MTLWHCPVGPNVYVANQKQILSGKVFVKTLNTNDLTKYSNSNANTFTFYCIYSNENINTFHCCIRLQIQNTITPSLVPTYLLGEYYLYDKRKLWLFS